MIASVADAFKGAENAPEGPKTELRSDGFSPNEQGLTSSGPPFLVRATLIQNLPPNKIKDQFPSKNIF